MEETKIHRYGMRLRPFGMGTFPKTMRADGECQKVIGCEPRNDRRTSGYWDILTTSEELTETEMQVYELDDLN